MAHDEQYEDADEETDADAVDPAEDGNRSIWKQRGRRFATGLNVSVSVLLAAMLALMVNYIAYRYYARWDVSASHFYRLSDRSRSLIASLKTDVEVLVFLRKGYDRDLYDDSRNLLKEYDYEAARAKPQRLHIEFVDPDRDLARTRDLKQKYEITDDNVVIVSSGGRTKFVEAKEIMEYERRLTLNARPPRKIAFHGEQVFSSAIQSVIQERRPVVYFLTGHGERSIQDFNEQSGYSGIARDLRRDNMDVRTLQLAERRGVPEDGSVLIIPGPTRRLSSAEVDMVARYLDKSGRLLLLVDPGVVTGLERLMEDWGVRLGRHTVVGYTYTGRDLIVLEYGPHAITRNLAGIACSFTQPRLIESTAAATAPRAAPDQPKVSILAANTAEGWAEADPNQNPPRYDPAVDKRGPVPVAVAVEKGLVKSIDMELKPTRLVVMGDGYFVSNGSLASAVGGNVDFFMNAVNWLTEREALLSVGPRIPGELRLNMTGREARRATVIIVGGFAAAAAALGFLVWMSRRR